MENFLKNLFNKAKSKNPKLTEEQFTTKRNEALSRADATGAVQQNMQTVGGMVMEGKPAEVIEIAKDLE